MLLSENHSERKDKENECLSAENMRKEKLIFLRRTFSFFWPFSSCGNKRIFRAKFQGSIGAGDGVGFVIMKFPHLRNIIVDVVEYCDVSAAKLIFALPTILP